MDDIRLERPSHHRRPEARSRPAVAPREPGWRSQLGMFAVVAGAVSVPQLLLSWRPMVGAIADFAAVALLLGMGLFSERGRKLAIAVTILPLASIVTLLLPPGPRLATVTVYYAAILLLALVYRSMFAADMPEGSLKSLRSTKWFLFVATVLGGVLGAVGFLMLSHYFDFPGAPWAMVIAGAVVFAVAEELLFQGLIQQLATGVMHPGLAAVLATLAYACASLGRQTILTVFFALIAGSVLAGLYLRRPSLVAVITTNALMKLMYFGLLAATIMH